MATHNTDIEKAWAFFPTAWVWLEVVAVTTSQEIYSVNLPMYLASVWSSAEVELSCILHDRLHPRCATSRVGLQLIYSPKQAHPLFQASMYLSLAYCTGICESSHPSPWFALILQASSCCTQTNVFSRNQGEDHKPRNGAESRYL